MRGISQIEIWGAHTARTMRVIWTAEELELAYSHHPIGPRTGETQTRAFSELNPKQKIPCLIDHSISGGLIVTESLAISRYLITAYANDELFLAAKPAEAAIEDEWCTFALSELDETSLYVIRRHRDLAHVYGGSSSVVEACFEYLERQLKVVEAHLKEREFVLDRGFSLADIMLTTCLIWAVNYGVTLGVCSSAYVSQMKLRESYKRARRVNYPG